MRKAHAVSTTGNETSPVGQNPPARAARESASFDKGVYTTVPAKLATNAVLGN
jgi:hypothetical protein